MNSACFHRNERDETICAFNVAISELIDGCCMGEDYNQLKGRLEAALLHCSRLVEDKSDVARNNEGMNYE